MNRFLSIHKKGSMKLLLKSIVSLALASLIIFNSSTSANGQTFSKEDEFTTIAVSVGFLLCAAVGMASISHNGMLTAEKNRDLNESELIEARDQLLEYQAKGESGLKDYQMEYLYPMLNKYLKRLRKVSSDNRSRSNDELIEIAIEDLLN